MDVEALRKKLSEISRAIEEQEMSLQDLHKQRSTVRNDLNSLRDPVTRLPLELSSNIFVACLPDTPTSKPPTPTAPAIFLCISRSWRTIALSTSSLWTSISDEHVPSSWFVKHFQKWSARSRDLPLSISLKFPLPGHEAESLRLVKQHAHRVRDLELSVLRGGESLVQITAPFTMLKTLTLENSSPSRHVNGMDECVELLRSAPRLEECIFRGIWYVTAFTHTPFIHQSLRHLCFAPIGNSSRHYNSSLAILRRLTLPALRSLAISELNITSVDFASFLARSSSSLQTLAIRVSTTGQLEETESYLQLTPTLVDLTIRDESGGAGKFLKILATRSDLLPNLQHLTLKSQFNFYNVDHDTRMAVVDLLTDRSASLRSFRLISDGINWIPADIVNVARQLSAAAVMEIQIGSQTFSDIPTAGSALSRPI